MSDVQLNNNICKNDGKPILVQIQKNTGFCCAKCEDEWALKQLKPATAKRVAKKAAAKKAVRTVVE